MIYFDNAATTWPKPDSVIETVEKCMRLYGANPGRSGHKMSVAASEKVFECRESVAEFFGLTNPNNVIFTFNATHALNIVINGVLKNGDHVICTQIDHNSVFRPLFAMRDDIEYSVAMADEEGYVSYDEICSHIKDNTKLIVMSHVSNVCGTILPFEQVACLARKKGILFLLDASQSAGIINIDMQKSKVDFLACSGHKSLFGPMGTGILCINSFCVPKPLMFGGTGSYSHLMCQPEEMPDKFESGTLNLPGICGLNEGINFVRSLSTDYILNHERKLISYLINNIAENSDYEIIGKKDVLSRTAVLSLVHKEKNSAVVANELSNNYNIAVRAMYHCSYAAHEALGTADGGTIRISLSAFSTMSQVKSLLYALEHI